MVQQSFSDNENSHTVFLDKAGKLSFGICIVSGEVKDSPNSKTTGIFIKGIVPDSPAQKCGKLKVGDRILYLNDKDVRSATEQTVINLIKDAGTIITLKVQTFSQKQMIENPKAVINNSTEASLNQRNASLKKGPAPSNKTDVNDNKVQPAAKNIIEYADDDDEDTRDMMGRMYTPDGFEIDRSSAGNVKFTRAEATRETETPDEFGYTTLKIKKRYGNLGNVLKMEVSRPPNSDMGLALAGHRDRQKMACFVAGINPQGLLSKANIVAGDEILEVNGNVLQNRCHLNASVVFKNLPGEKIVFIIHRRKGKDEGVSVKPITQFAPIVDETEYLFTTYKNVRSVQVQKSGSIGIMIIEGKHKDVGNGIFISDLQAESKAEEAGLKVGEMILAINKDILVETNYDTAAGILKRAGGIVTLVVCCLKNEAEVAAEQKAKEAPPEPEKPADPSVAEIKTNKKTLIEIKVEKKPLGCIVSGGKNNYVKTGCVITHIYPDSVVGKDNRLQVFDQIIEINGSPINCAELTTLKVHQLFHMAYEKVTMMVWRNDPPETETLNIEFAKKAGKEFGLSLAPNNKGVTIVEITPAGYADIDNKLQRGDVISKFNDDSMENLTFEQCYGLIKAANGKIAMTILRPKPTTRTK